MTTAQFYNMPSQGLGTDFSESSRPISFAATYTNRFRNITGGAEKRPGMQRSFAAVPTAPNLTRLHEFVSDVGAETLLSSDDFGNIYAYNASANTWSNVKTGLSFNRLISAEANGKLIFVNGVDRNIYTQDGGQTFSELKALITTGKLAASSNATTVIDGDISNWIGATLAANNDIVHNTTLDAYGIVTAIASASLTITSIGSAATGAGNASRNQAPNDTYELIDYVDLNIIPQGRSDGSDNIAKDNVAVATTGTTTTVIAVSGVNFANTEIRTADFIYNTTRSAVALVGSVSANINIQQAITGQVPGDSIVFFKSAMPIASWVHVHYGRAYFLDSRNNNRVVISAPDDPQDVTTYQKTLDSTSFRFGTQQPTGDSLVSLGTFMSYFVAAGKKNLYIYQGNTPIQDSSATTLNFTPIAFYPNGVGSRFGISTNGGDLLHITLDGLQAINIGYNAFNTVQNNASVPIRTTLINAIQAVNNTDNIQLTYYPRRSWVINKIGDQCFVLNTIPSYGPDGKPVQIASWHLYTGKWAQQNHYFVRRNGDLLACGAQGLVYYMDSSASTDDGPPIPTEITTAWLRLEEPQYTPRVKTGYYIKPLFESSPDTGYTIMSQAGYDNFSGETITVSAQGGGQIGSAIVGITPIGTGSFVADQKYPLAWRGEQVRITYSTNTSSAPDIITGFTLYGDIGGYR